MSNLAELALARIAILSGVTGCCEWNEKEAQRVTSDQSLKGLTPAYVKKRLFEFISNGGELKQIPEGRPRYSHREYYYKAIVSEPDFPHGIFVELELIDDDPELPCVILLNAHPQIG